jgi:HAD superfamily hydrolase (TIGR01509 family)
VAIRAVLLDVDGTLVDSNDAHAKAWSEALREHGREVAYDEIRWRIGKGGDKLAPEVTGLDPESAEGKQLRDRAGEIFRAKYVRSLQAFPGARELLARFRAEGLTLVVATSASKRDMNEILKTAGLDALIDEHTSSSDAKRSKPDPDIVQAAVERADADVTECLMLGDTPYDVQAAQRAGVRAVGLRCGGWNDDELAGAVAVYDGPADLLANYAASPFARNGR